jgi:5-methyltetrahydrofolate--homocysteine methyltransferase
MERRGLRKPLLIGGATTSKQHTAVRIAPAYGGITVHVLDASRAVGVVSALLDDARREDLDRSNRETQQRLRDLHGAKRDKPLLSYPQARERRLAVDWRAEDLPVPEFIGRRLLTRFPLAELVGYIDWTFFFSAWELKGRFPRILDHPKLGPAARDLYGHARELLARIVDEQLLTAQAAYGFWPAASEGDDLVLYEDASRSREAARFPMLRQQRAVDERPRLSLADFVAPVELGLADHVGAFAVTAGLDCEELVARFEAQGDDYQAIMTKALADRMAEAFAEALHQRVRREWGYGQDEDLDNEDLIAERYRGIRPAFGYPACPDHSEKRRLFALLGAEEAGLSLTESFAMHPAASVSGLYLAHPQARYFDVGPIGRDQLASYARRKGMSVAEAERWLRPNLGYAADDAEPPAAAVPAE